MAFFENRAGAEEVEALLSKAAGARRPLLMSVVNWGEVYYSIWRTQGEATANEKLRQIAQLPIEVVDADAPLAKSAASLKAQYNLPYADCFAAALALNHKVAVVTGDRDFERVASLVRTVWV